MKASFLILVLTCTIVILTIAFNLMRKNESWTTYRHVGSPFVETKLTDVNITVTNNTELGVRIINIAQLLRVARLHARGTKTTLALKRATDDMDDILRDFGTSFYEVTKRKVFKSKSICPEHFVDPLYGFPQYDVGYRVENCTYATALEKLCTVLLLDPGLNGAMMEQVLWGIRGYKKDIRVVLGTYGTQIRVDGNTELVNIPKDTPKGDALNDLIAKVTTEYTLIARDVIQFNYDARIDRLVREIERLNVLAVGGSIRNADSIWNMACHQRAFHNSTVVYREGYDESLHDCVFCDHIDGPFLIRTDTLKYIQFDGRIAPMGLYEDFFMRIENEVAVCPDSMFYVEFPKRGRTTAAWESFGRKRNLYKLKFSSGPVINFGCNYPYPCNKVKGYVRSPCCIKELTDINNDVMKMCETSGIICEFQYGTLLGAVKLGKTLPWEIDGDIRVWYENFTALEKAGEQLKDKGYRFQKMKYMGECNTTSKLMSSNGYYYVYSKHWFVEIYTYCGMDSYDLLSQHLNRTKVLHNGYAAIGTRNPPLVMRNMYPRYYGHVQHIREGGVWNVHHFSKCKDENRHDCIDRYNEDGNLQFEDPIP